MLVNISRLVLALCFLVPVVAVVGWGPSPSSQQVYFLGVSGVVGLAVGDSFLFRSYKQIGPRIAMLIMSASPAIAAILAFLVLDERLSLLGILGMAVTLTGIVVVVRERRPGSAIVRTDLASGVVFASLGAVTQGVGLIFAKLAFREAPMNGFVAAAVRIACALIVMLPVVILLGRTAHPVQKFRADRRALGLTMLGSILGPFLGISFSLMAVANTTVGIASTLMSTVPIVMLPIVRFVYQERLTWQAIAGAFIAVAGVVMLFLR
jgi:drug/metabolite transporter (DMT)-like permease